MYSVKQGHGADLLAALDMSDSWKQRSQRPAQRSEMVKRVIDGKDTDTLQFCQNTSLWRIVS